MIKAEKFIQFIGKPAKEVIDYVTMEGGRYRITRKDGKSTIVTADFDICRINLHIENDTVTHAYWG